MKCNNNCKHVIHLVVLAIVAALIINDCGCCKCKCTDDNCEDEECKCE